MTLNENDPGTMTLPASSRMACRVAEVAMISQVKPGPAIKSTLLNVRDVIRHEIVAQTVAPIGPNPKFVGPRPEKAMPTALRMPEAKDVESLFRRV